MADDVAAHVLGPGEGRTVKTGGLGIRFMIEAGETDGRFSLVEHPMEPRSLGSPVHTHANEDEYSYVLEGEVGVQIGEEILAAGPGTLVRKPRGVPHAFWNGTDRPARLFEIISPAGFERYFDEMAEALPKDREPTEVDLGRIAAVGARYGLELDFASVPALMERHGLVQ
jgi:mannose-6-phosphate isomerase-like protein (cupin superfamily)